MMASPPRFVETERLRLVPWSDAYSDRFADLCADAEAMRFISRGTPYHGSLSMRSCGERERCGSRMSLQGELAFRETTVVWYAIDRPSSRR
jgi:hypothetical protein